MNFLKADCVRLRKEYSDRVVETPLYSKYEMEQQLYVDLGSNSSPDKLEVIAIFSSECPAPKKISLSANQYTMNPFEIKVSLYKKYGRRPYKSFTLGEIRSIFELEEDTRKIVLEFIDVDNERRFADVKLIVNYAKF
jgi:hypothetical protein